MSPPMPRLDRTLLRGVERAAVPTLELVNSSRALKALTYPFWHFGSRKFVTTLSGRLYEPHGLDYVRELQAPSGVVMIANHRSFFDLFFTAACAVDAVPSFCTQMVFPVRKDFFYDTVPGLLLNLTLTFGSMWPPIFRDERKGVLNPAAMDQLGAALRRGTLCGIHPEGTRGRGDDPWMLGDAKAGVGHLLRSAAPDVMVLPTFILGVSSDFTATARRNFRPKGQRGEPVRIWFGPPCRAEDLVAAGGGSPQGIAEAATEKIRLLAEQDRQSWMARPRQA